MKADTKKTSRMGDEAATSDQKKRKGREQRNRTKAVFFGIFLS